MFAKITESMWTDFFWQFVPSTALIFAYAKYVRTTRPKRLQVVVAICGGRAHGPECLHSNKILKPPLLHFCPPCLDRVETDRRPGASDSSAGATDLASIRRAVLSCQKPSIRGTDG